MIEQKSFAGPKSRTVPASAHPRRPEANQLMDAVILATLIASRCMTLFRIAISERDGDWPASPAQVRNASRQAIFRLSGG